MTLLEQIEKEVRILPPEKQAEVLDFITFLQQRIQATRSEFTEEERGRRIKVALQTLADLGTFADIQDPVEWQRRIRKDRPLPGREE